jgi:hypothetical protein
LFADEQEEQEEQVLQTVLCNERDVAETPIPLTSRINHREVLLEYTRDGHRVNLGRDLRCSTVIPVNTNGHYQNPFHNNNNNNDNVAISPMAQAREHQQLYTPNLSIPDDDGNYLTRAQ